METGTTKEDGSYAKCAREQIFPWAIAAVALICVTLGLGFYYRDDIDNVGRADGHHQTDRAGGRPISIVGRPVALSVPWHSREPMARVDATAGATPKRTSFNQAIMRVSPSVVGINTSGANGRGASGIIVHRQGYILTNHHVVDGAKDIVVTLTLDQIIKAYPAHLVDTRPGLDLAILKLKGTGKTVFIPAPLGNSDTLLIGDDVVVIGSPFGLSGSASAGIISNTKRTLTAGKTVYRDLIQTDAAINPGSSGGALVNANAEVIGVNMAIYSPVEGFTGVGFAIPINRARKEFSHLMETAIPLGPQNNALQRVRLAAQKPTAYPQSFKLIARRNKPKTKCWLGIAANTVDDVVIREFKLPFRTGVLVNRVFPNSPASKADIVRGDVIYRVNFRRIKDDQMLWKFLDGKKKGSKVGIIYFRNGKFKKGVVRLEAEPPNARALLADTPQGPGAGGEGIEEISWMGVDIQPLVAGEALAEFGISPDQPGVFVGEVEGLAAIDAGLASGDVIKRINGRRVDNMLMFRRVIMKVDISKGVLLDVLRDRRPFFITIRPTRQDMGAWQ